MNDKVVGKATIPAMTWMAMKIIIDDNQCPNQILNSILATRNETTEITCSVGMIQFLP